MRLTKVRVQNYRSVEDSEEFEIGDLTCLVGKNEAGKTALLNAIRGLRPIDNFDFDKTIDYPRRHYARYAERHEGENAEVVRGWWQLDSDDVAAVEKRFGPGVLKSDTFQTIYSYDSQSRIWLIDTDNGRILEILAATHELDESEKAPLAGITNGLLAVKALSGLTERTSGQEALLNELRGLKNSSLTQPLLNFLAERQPKFFYTSHFDRMSGKVSVERLQADKSAQSVTVSDQIFLDFLEYAGTTLDDLLNANRREELKALCEAASNDITEEIFQFWSQNNALEVEIDIGAGKPGDAPPFNGGTVADIRIKNTNHKASLPLSERSAGFVWFFSFLAQFKQLKKKPGNSNAILLLDEPGLTLHGKAQGDLIRYMIERLLPDHQVIFTTHSPFMVPMDRIEDVRIVEDVVVRTEGRPLVKGTKVRSDVLEVERDTLFPLQGALGYEITQSLFVGPNTLLVEGPSDILYLQVFSQALRQRGRVGLDPRWTLCPTGGIDKIAPFVSLFGGNRLNVVVLSDIAQGDKNKIEKLRKSDILKAGHFYTCADFVDQSEADVEDLLGQDLFVQILNAAYNVPTEHELSVEKLMELEGTPRIVKRAEELFRLMPDSVAEFDHFRPSQWLLENSTVIDNESAALNTTLVRFEALFKTFNSLI